MKKIYKKSLITFIMGSLAAALLYFRSEYEKQTLSVKKYSIKTDKISKKRRLVFLSDLHNACFGENNSGLLNEIEKLKPDAVIIGGDIPTVKSKVDLVPGVFLCDELSLLYPVYYGNGNHELRMRNRTYQYGNSYFRYKKCLEGMGIHYLSDAGEKLDDDIMIYGLDINEKYYAKFRKQKMYSGYIGNRLGRADRERFNILLAHTPMYLEAYSDWGADLVLSGHFHGGTVRLCGGIGLMTPQFHFFSDKVTGMRKMGKTSHIISAGLGTHSVNIRLNNKPQIVVVDLEKMKDD